MRPSSTAWMMERSAYFPMALHQHPRLDHLHLRPAHRHHPPQACQTCFDASCGGTKKLQGPCQNCLQANQANCSSSCAPYPFEELLEWYCGKTNATNVIV